MAEVSSLIARLENDSTRPARVDAFEHQLVQVRLGLASGLFHALRCKHTDTATHSLRVALTCSSWALAMDLPDREREELEVAALLHDVGKIGVPDAIMLKPGVLTPDQVALMNLHRAYGLEILQSCCASDGVLDNVRMAPVWFDGSKRYGESPDRTLSRGARMLSIVDAFDSMIADHVYRPAASRERALNELFEFAGRQFDPELVRMFHQLQSGDPQQLDRRVAGVWLLSLDPTAANDRWQFNLNLPTAAETEPNAMSLYQHKLIDNMYDAVVFLDLNLQVVLWNRGAERMTGIPSGSMRQRPFTPSLLKMRDERGDEVSDFDCPVAYAIHSKVQSMRRMIIAGRDGRDVAVDLHAVPVMSAEGAMHGASLLFHDVSEESSLEQRCQKLHERAIKDPLTQLANRAEFDRVLRMFVEVHLQRKRPCGMIICDIDRFKSVNDTYGHPAGDEVIKSFASVMTAFCGPGDLAARYGGEEFVLLCADCNNATAAARAEEMRQAFGNIEQSLLGGKRITASFGVTEIQAGDTPETMLCRADRALLEAKETGRNRVVQLGGGIVESVQPARRRWWSWFTPTTEALVDRALVTPVPLSVAVEKLRGFVADHRGEVDSIDAGKIVLSIQGRDGLPTRRSSDRTTPFGMELTFVEERGAGKHPAQGQSTFLRTRIQVLIRPKRGRDRRRADAVERARYLLSSLRSYLMASEVRSDAETATDGPPAADAFRITPEA